MKKLAEMLGLGAGEVVSIVGCGGKTTLLWGLAWHYREQRVLVTTSTKIGWPARGKYDSVTDAGNIACLMPPSFVRAGVHLCGTLYSERAHIKSPPISDLGALLPNFDKTLIEADGSRMLPVKGWDKYEPVIPDFSTMTIGIATIGAEGHSIDERTVHRPRIFCRLAGAAPGQALTLEHMAAVIAHPEGLMARAVGRRILLINQLDGPSALARARAFVKLLPPDFLRGLGAVIGASLRNGTAELLY